MNCLIYACNYSRCLYEFMNLLLFIWSSDCSQTSHTNMVIILNRCVLVGGGIECEPADFTLLLTAGKLSRQNETDATTSSPALIFSSPSFLYMYFSVRPLSICHLFFTFSCFFHLCVFRLFIFTSSCIFLASNVKKKKSYLLSLSVQRC